MIEAAEKYIPEGNDTSRVFRKIQEKYRGIRSAKDIDTMLQRQDPRVMNVAGDFFTAAVAFISNRSNHPVLEDIGDKTWAAVNQKLVLPVVTNNTISAAVQLGLPAQIALQKATANESFLQAIEKGKKPFNALHEDFDDPEPWVFFGGSRQSNGAIGTTGYVLLTSDFIGKCLSQPHLALTTMAYLGSHVRDFVLHRFGTESGQIIEGRSRAVEAQFLLGVMTREPSLVLPDLYQRVLTEYPQGLDTPGLSSSIKYVSGDTMPSDPSRN
jgi:hypothetical protein